MMLKIKFWMSLAVLGILSGCGSYEMDKLDVSEQDVSLLTPPVLEKK